MQNIKLKRDLINTGRYFEIEKIRYQLWKENKYYNTRQLEELDPEQKIEYLIKNRKANSHKRIYEYNGYLEVKKKYDCTEEEYKCCEQLRKSRSKQRQEIKAQLKFWINQNYEITFNTYTLNDETLNTYISDIDKLQNNLTRLLSKYTLDYIGNIDYGKINGRIHFHVLEAHKTIQEEIINNNRHITITPIHIEWQKYGFSNGERITYRDTSYEKLCGYLAKISNHSIKVKKKRLFKKKYSEYKLRKTQYIEFVDRDKQKPLSTEKYELIKLIDMI